MSKRELGQRGEALACEFLVAKGYRIVRTNYYTRRGEIDIIAQKGGELAFIEVKYRRDLEQGHPSEAITKAKLRKFRTTVLLYLQEEEEVPNHLEMRFHAIAVLELPGQLPAIEMFEHILGP